MLLLLPMLFERQLNVADGERRRRTRPDDDGGRWRLAMVVTLLLQPLDLS